MPRQYEDLFISCRFFFHFFNTHSNWNHTEKISMTPTSATMTRKFVKRFKLSAISSEYAAAPWPYCQQVGMQMDLLSAGSSYIEPRPAAGIICCSVWQWAEGGKADSSVPPQAKAAWLVTNFYAKKKQKRKKKIYSHIYGEKEKPFMNTRIYTLVVHLIYMILSFWVM